MRNLFFGAVAIQLPPATHKNLQKLAQENCIILRNEVQNYKTFYLSFQNPNCDSCLLLLIHLNTNKMNDTQPAISFNADLYHGQCSNPNVISERQVSWASCLPGYRPVHRFC